MTIIKRKPLRALSIFCLLALVLWHGSPLSAQPQAPQGGVGDLIGTPRNAGDDLKPFFYVDVDGIWPKYAISVCWEPGPENFGSEKTMVTSAVRQYIEGNSSYRFGDNWTTCDQSQIPRIRIVIQDVNPRSEVGYQQIPGLIGGPTVGPTHMKLNFTFASWSPVCASSLEFRSRCIQTIAVHEFFHALGALHEQLYPDIEVRDPACWQKYKGMPDFHGRNPHPLTAYDPDSIMNYCRNIYSEPTRLSQLDLVGLKKLSDLTGMKQQH